MRVGKNGGVMEYILIFALSISMGFLAIATQEKRKKLFSNETVQSDAMSKICGYGVFFYYALTLPYFPLLSASGIVGLIVGVVIGDKAIPLKRG